MTVRIFQDVEEAIAREVRRITFHDNRTVDYAVLKEVFDVLTGEIVQIPIEPSFYDSSSDASNIDYPHFFIKLLSSREDIYSGRVVPQYGNEELCPVATSPRAFEQVLYLGDGNISSAGNNINTGTFRISRVEPGFWIRILSGPNIGTYIIDSVTISNIGDHTITVASELIEDLPASSFNVSSRVVSFLDPFDLSTVKVGDIFQDDSSTNFNITALDAAKSQITIDGVGSPDVSSGGNISRSGDMFLFDPSLVVFSVLDPSKPVTASSLRDNATEQKGLNPQVPLDLFYLVRIDSKEKDDHTAIANRIWEEFFNPPRTALPVVVRTKLSAEQKLAVDVPSGGSDTLDVGDNANYNIGEEVLIFDDFTPTKSSAGGFGSPHKAKVLDKISNNQLVFNNIVPDTFKVDNNTKVVSNAEFRLYMFHFVDHKTRDVEGSQYWVHEFQSIIQVWIDRQGEPTDFDGVIQNISTPIEDLDSNIIINDL